MLEINWDNVISEVAKKEGKGVYTFKKEAQFKSLASPEVDPLPYNSPLSGEISKLVKKDVEKLVEDHLKHFPVQLKLEDTPIGYRTFDLSDFNEVKDFFSFMASLQVYKHNEFSELYQGDIIVNVISGILVLQLIKKKS